MRLVGGDREATVDDLIGQLDTALRVDTGEFVLEARVVQTRNKGQVHDRPAVAVSPGDSAVTPAVFRDAAHVAELVWRR